MESRGYLEHLDAANKGPMSTSSRGNDHIHAVEQAVEMESRSEDVGSSSPDQIQHKTNPSFNNPIYDEPASPLYPSLPGEPSGVALGEKTNITKPSKSELSYNPVKRQQVSHVNEAFQESDVALNNVYNGEHESQPKTERSIYYLPKGQSPQDTTSC